MSPSDLPGNSSVVYKGSHGSARNLSSENLDSHDSHIYVKKGRGVLEGLWKNRGKRDRKKEEGIRQGDRQKEREKVSGAEKREKLKSLMISYICDKVTQAYQVVIVLAPLLLQLAFAGPLVGVGVENRSDKSQTRQRQGLLSFISIPCLRRTPRDRRSCYPDRCARLACPHGGLFLSHTLPWS